MQINVHRPLACWYISIEAGTGTRQEGGGSLGGDQSREITTVENGEVMRRSELLWNRY